MRVKYPSKNRRELKKDSSPPIASYTLYYVLLPYYMLIIIVSLYRMKLYIFNDFQYDIFNREGRVTESYTFHPVSCALNAYSVCFMSIVICSVPTAHSIECCVHRTGCCLCLPTQPFTSLSPESGVLFQIINFLEEKQPIVSFSPVFILHWK